MLMPLMFHLNNNVVGLRTFGLSGGDLASNKGRYVSILASKHFECLFYEFDAYFHLSIALMVA